MLGTIVIRNRAIKSGELICKLFNCSITIRFIRKHGTYNDLCTCIVFNKDKKI